MGQSHGNRIGRIGRRRHSEAEECPDHEGHLGLLRGTGAHHGLFHAARRVFVDRQSPLGRRQKNRPPGTSQCDGCWKTLDINHAFHRDALRSVSRDGFAQACVDFEQTTGHREARRIADHIKVKATHFRSCTLKHGISSAPQGGVDSQQDFRVCHPTRLRGFLSRLNAAMELPPESFQSDLTGRDSQVGTKPMMLMSGFWILVSLGLLYAGAAGLVRGSASLALRLGLTPLVVGLTVVAMGTSMPEVLVSVDAALQNRGDLAVGNVIGSNIFNVGIILGFTALLSPMKVQFQLIKFDAPIMAAVMFVIPLVLWDGVVTRWEGVGLFAGLVAYVLFNVRLARRTASETVTAEYQEGVPAKSGSMALDLGFIILGLGLLAVGARLLTENSVAVARGFGVSEAVIGLTIVAVGTSVPELAASIVAALKKEPDIALGNVVGSNIFNILGILGIASIVRPLEAAQISRFDMWSMVAIGVALVPMLMTGLRLGRREGGVLVAAYCVYVAMLWPK